eukprot:6067453-Prymnesium_polylepis.2
MSATDPLLELPPPPTPPSAPTPPSPPSPLPEKNPSGVAQHTTGEELEEGWIACEVGDVVELVEQRLLGAELQNRNGDERHERERVERYRAT